MACGMEGRVMQKCFAAGHNPQSTSKTNTMDSRKGSFKILQDLGFSKTEILKVFDKLPDSSLNVGIDQLIDMLYDTDSSPTEALTPAVVKMYDKGIYKNNGNIAQQQQQQENTDVLSEEGSNAKQKGFQDARPKIFVTQNKNPNESVRRQGGKVNKQTKGGLKEPGIQNEYENLSSLRSLPNKPTKAVTGMETEVRYYSMQDMARNKTSQEQPDVTSNKSMEVARSSHQLQHSSGQRNEEIKIRNHPNANDPDNSNNLAKQDQNRSSPLMGLEDTKSSNPLQIPSEPQAATRKKIQKKHTPEEISRIRELKHERDKLLGNKICNACETNEINLLFLPCRHMVTCESCGEDMASCMKCEKTIIATVKIFKL